MKQILQNLRSGEILTENVPSPSVKPGHLLIQTSKSLISAGTERMLLEFGRAGYLSKARQQPEKVRQVLAKLRSDGLIPTVETVMSRLDQPLPMGYCNVGHILEVGADVRGFRPGDRVASNGHHAEVVLVPKNLCARIPERVTDESACFTVVGAIALQGIRLLKPTLGESIAVFGLGLIGNVATQILLASGAKVIGFDFDSTRLAPAQEFGVRTIDLSTGVDPVEAARSFSGDQGIDGVLVTAATQSNELMHQAAQMSRKRGRIILTGVAGLHLRRSDFYEKELSFQVSCSYGPGRYDPEYEEKGRDYPPGFVRWTLQRNLETILDLLEREKIKVEDLISERVSVMEAQKAYNSVAAKTVVSVLLDYPRPESEKDRLRLTSRTIKEIGPRRPADKVTLAIIGAGSFTQLKILPALRKTGAGLKWIASATGVNAAAAARKFGIKLNTTDLEQVFGDEEVDAILIATLHDTHAPLVIKALQAGKSVFVEKPLCLSLQEAKGIEQAYIDACNSNSDKPILMVGYNRRFAPLTIRLRNLLRGRQQPLAMNFTCNAGAIPADHWVHDPKVGGGRIMGEACHFIDLLHFLTGESAVRTVVGVQLEALGTSPVDTAALSLKFADGSIGHINYFSNGVKAYAKECLEVFCEGCVFRLENFRRLRVFGAGLGGGKKALTQDKGHDAEFKEFVEALVRGSESPIDFTSIMNTTRATIAAVQALSTGQTVEMGEESVR